MACFYVLFIWNKSCFSDLPSSINYNNSKLTLNVTNGPRFSSPSFKSKYVVGPIIVCYSAAEPARLQIQEVQSVVGTGRYDKDTRTSQSDFT